VVCSPKILTAVLVRLTYSLNVASYAPRSLGVIALLAASACGDASDPANPVGWIEPGGSGGRASAPEYGLEARPANATCRIPMRPTGAASDVFPKTLSATGCLDPGDPRKPLPGVIAYDVNVPLFSDDAAKHRFFALPDGAAMHIEANGHLRVPAGSVLIKLFELSGVPVETRLLVRHDDGAWAGYSYAWRNDASDADLLETTLSRRFGADEWTYPSRQNCLDCHTEAAGWSLGTELAQLNRTFEYTRGRSEQLATLANVGLIAGELPQPLPEFPAPSDVAASIEKRARAYLHTNCANCHRPGGKTGVSFDARFDTPLAAMQLCDVNPSKGNFGLVGAKLLKPSEPTRSLLSLRMHTSIASARMPPTGRTRTDTVGTEIVDAWIASLGACP
jgi:uncharacterized repeat protein (TIGR03806 family)